MAGTPAGGSAATGGPAVHPTLLVGLGTLGARTAALLHSLLAEENLAVARLHPCVLIQDATAGSEKWDWASWVEVPGTGGGGGPGGPPATRSAWQDALASLADVVRQEFDRRLRITQAEIAEIATVLGRAVDARERSVVLVGDLADPLGSALLLPTAVIARSCLDALRLDAGALLCLLDAGVAPGTPGP
jgi:hypothetical protein